MRPTALAEACRRAQTSERFAQALHPGERSAYANLLPRRGYRGARADAGRRTVTRFDDTRYDALVGGIAEHLFKRWAPFHPPPWIKSRDRYLDLPWWPVGEGDPALMEYLTWASPPEFKSHNIMTDDAPLRRATQPSVQPLPDPRRNLAET